MTINFDENKFINNIVSFYLNNNYYYDENIVININNNYSLIFDIFFIKMTKTNNCKVLLKQYCTKEEIKDAKYRFKENYVELKLSIILYQKFINALINMKKNLMLSY
jgi:hypothetical protein